MWPVILNYFTVEEWTHVLEDMTKSGKGFHKYEDLSSEPQNPHNMKGQEQWCISVIPVPPGGAGRSLKCPGQLFLPKWWTIDSERDPNPKTVGRDWGRHPTYLNTQVCMHLHPPTHTHMCSQPHRQHKKELWRVLFSYIHLVSALTTADSRVHLDNSLLPCPIDDQRKRVHFLQTD